ncbi:DUF6895 family protein [Streptomyces sp. NPDC088729]|uniref:DUF6895 family protein n=1 Tax=Streptomyces sp. NPDC088729 TaxID=3365876 RepID=UPI00381C5DF0
MTATATEGSGRERAPAATALHVLPGVLRTALDWTNAHRAEFALPADALDAHTDVNATFKPLGELAQLCVTIRRDTEPGTPEHTAADGLVTFAWEQVERGALLLELLRAEPFASYPYEIYAAFAAEGLRHEGFERLAHTLGATRSWAHIEQHPNRQLGLVNSERRVGTVAHADSGTVLSRTWLGGLAEPWMFEGPSGYALTHTVFHLTDWGGAPDRLPESLAAYLRTWLPAWTDGCLESGHWDLAGELLAVAAVLPGPPAPALLDTAWPVLADVQDAGGSIPETGPPARRNGTSSAPGGGTTSPVAGATSPVAGTSDPYPFYDCYHSTLVTAFAAALSLRALRSPPSLRSAGAQGRERQTA